MRYHKSGRDLAGKKKKRYVDDYQLVEYDGKSIENLIITNDKSINGIFVKDKLRLSENNSEI